MINPGVLVSGVGMWVLCQVFGGRALYRLGLLHDVPVGPLVSGVGVGASVPGSLGGIDAPREGEASVADRASLPALSDAFPRSGP